MNDFSSHAYRQWYVVGLSADLASGPRPALLLGAAVALGRLPSGEILALADQCPHRGVPLSDGRMLPQGLACRYHGWTFDATGQCVGVPGAPPEQYGDICVAAYTVRERDGLVWATRSAQARFPERIGAMDPEQRRILWQTKWRVPILEAQQRVLKGLPAIAARRDPNQRRFEAGLDVTHDGFLIDWSASRAPAPWTRRLFGSVAEGVRAYLSGLGTLQFEYRDARGWRAWTTFCFSPETLVSTRLFATVHVDDRRVPTWRIRASLAPLLQLVVEHDRASLQGSGRTTAGHMLAASYLEEAWRGPERLLPSHCDIALDF